MRIYETSGPNPEADRIFYTLVKPVHEKHGAMFMGRYVDQVGKHIVLWQYESIDEMKRIQDAVTQDADSIRSIPIRRTHGLHGVEFEEFIMSPTGSHHNPSV